VNTSASCELLERLISIESVNPTLVPGGAGEAELARFVASWLEDAGLEVDLHELAPSRANVIARVRGSGSGRSLILNGHLDTVGLAGNADGVTPRVEDGRLYGRGAYDMKGSLAAIMLAAAEASRSSLSGDVIVTAVADEEDGSIGTEAVVERVRADGAIVTEPTDLRLALSHRGFVWLELEARGLAAHGSRYDLGVDAITKLSEALAGVRDLDARFARAMPHPVLGRASVHASLIEGGHELSTYPDRCVLKVERRTLPGETVQQVEDELRAVAGEASVRSFFSREPLETSPDEAIVATFQRHAEAVLGRAPEVIGVPFWTDAALLAAAGIPTVVFGPRGEGAHADLEWVELADVERLAEILLATATEFCA